MPCVLCIDDSVHGLSVRRHILEEHGYDVFTARCGREGLERFKSEKVNLVVVDYLMPEMNGAEVIRQLRKLAPKLPVILLSGYADTLDLDQKVPEADQVLHKGRAREAKELIEAVENLLRRRNKKPSGRATLAGRIATGRAVRHKVTTGRAARYKITTGRAVQRRTTAAKRR